MRASAVPRIVVFAAGALSTLALAPGARAEDEGGTRGEFSLGVGYARINFDGGGPLLEGRDAVHVDPVVSFSPIPDLPQFRLGGAVGFSAALDDTRGIAIFHDGESFIATSSDVFLMLFEPEVRLSWRQPLGRDGDFFIEPGVAAGAAIGYLDVGDEDDKTPGAADAHAFDETDVSFQWKVFLRAGMRVTGGLAGIEASYMQAGRLEFSEDLGGRVDEFYVGIFGAIQF